MTFHFTHWPVVAVIAVTTAGCALDKISDPDKPSDFQVHMERQAALTLPEPAVLTELAVEPEPALVPMPAPLLAPVTPPCHEVYRITRCVNGVAEDWGF